MPVINWNENAPAGGDSLGVGDDEIRSTKSAIRTALDAEHVWPAVGGDAGVHRLGSARPYYGTQSFVSSTGSDARLMVTSDSSRLFHVGSAGTMFLGGQAVLSVGSSPVGGQRFYWATEFGIAQSNVAGIVVVTWPNSGFSGRPFILATAEDTIAASNGYIVAVQGTPTGTSATFGVTLASTPKSSITFNWMSIGTRTF